MFIIDSILVLFRRFYTFNVILAKQFIQDQCTRISAALTFTTLLAIVPLLAIALMVIRQMPFFPDLLNYLLVFLQNIFSPEISSIIENYLLVFADKAAHLANLSLVIFVVTALMTLYTIDTTLNQIWHVAWQRNILATIIIYICTLILAPLIIGFSIFITTYLTALPYISETLAYTGLNIPLFAVWPVVLVGVIFSLIYKTIPNVHIYWHHALAGGTIAAILFEFSKQVFALYLEWFPTYELIYGSIAAIPLLLIWIYVAWLVVLLGAEITFLLGQTHLEPYREGTDLLVLYDILRQLRTTENPLSTHKLQKIGQWNNTIILKSLMRLQKEGIICKKNIWYWELTGGFAALTLYDLMLMSGIALPQPTEEWINRSSANRFLTEELFNLKKATITLKSQTISELIDPSGTTALK